MCSFIQVTLQIKNTAQNKLEASERNIFLRSMSTTMLE